MNGLRLVRAALLLAAAAAIAGCEPPADETWLRVVAFLESGSEKAISSLESDLTDDESGSTARKTDYVQVKLENGASGVGSTAETGITVTHARVTYRMGGYAFPSYDYDVYLYIAPPGKDGNTSGTLDRFPIVTAGLKDWIRANVPGAVGSSAVANVTLSAQTDEGRDVETEAGLGVIFK